MELEFETLFKQIRPTLVCHSKKRYMENKENVLTKIHIQIRSF